MSEQPKFRIRATYAIIALIGVWSVILAIGAFQSGTTDWRRPLFVLGTIGSFVLIWLVAMLRRVDHK